MHRNLSQNINKVIKAGENEPVIDIRDQEKGSMFEVVTGHTTYTIVVIDPAQQEIAMKTNNPNIPTIDVWYLMGAGWGGSLMKIGCVVVNAQMRARRLSGGLIETSPVQRWTKLNDPVEAKRILDEAEARRPQIMTQTEQDEYNAKFAQVVENLILREFEVEDQQWIRELVNCFGNNAAKGVVLGVVTQAKTHGKLKEARELLERDWRRHWKFQPPPMAGDPEAMPLNSHRWDALYRELGVPFPGQ